MTWWEKSRHRSYTLCYCNTTTSIGSCADIDINVKENQTGTFTAGAAFGTLDGITLVTGLNESNIGGTGRSVELLVNNSEDNSEYKFNISDKVFYNRGIKLNFGINYKESDFSKSSSYNLDKLQISTGLSYSIQDNLYHSVRLNYELDDVLVTDQGCEVLTRNIPKEPDDIEKIMRQS